MRQAHEEVAKFKIGLCILFVILRYSKSKLPKRKKKCATVYYDLENISVYVTSEVSFKSHYFLLHEGLKVVLTLFLLHFVSDFNPFTFKSDAKSYWWSSITKILCTISIWVQFFLYLQSKKTLPRWLKKLRTKDSPKKRRSIHSASNSLPNHATVSVSSVL